ncbi:MAG: PTS sugar transporter subunit IIC [Liquorilactobacillus nagelii]|jgi:PTS system cellobiose-specific IIC component|uniref:Permease IIC component n=3 Tax=Liquorilactobacillus nagelii TaxID=82688 RepID=A0A3Q8CZQ7_9LACO|nr:PTS sugar transporter subunit IIC [Liquorilactobacillus nagelii]AUJ32590.1 PTS cellobiose transporter subunit IIC [Liquorilactobacillus nagelii]MCC7616743.1 PTS cellobiose transporter subunit IIC [Liquorilactobacillus nagelii]MCI1634226.1 PTS sugar transporter subunit IIC [Liquorilactobacillus nagelii]MCI1699876.1 PTS sugar transporter subunit IIC [Liquorilactobacillus nagelii]MCP9315858.1 PTS sugar transporter subunit IIC [Liquorilactobacillus nagelii]
MVKNKFGDFVNQKVLPPIMKFVNTKPITALKDGMVYALPFIIIGSIFLILSNIPITSVANALKASGWSAVFSQAYTASFGLISVWASIGIAYVYVRNEGYEPLPAGLTSLSAFLILQFLQVDNPLIATMGKSGSGIANAAGSTVMSGSQVAQHIDKLPHALQTFLSAPVTNTINITWLGGQGMIAAIIIGILVGWSYTKMLKAGWKITLPEQVPANVANQFTAMIPAGVILTVSMLLYAFFKMVMSTDLLQLIYKLLQTPLQGLSDSLGGALIIAFLVPFFWFFGVHGGLIMGAITSGLLIPNTFDNASLYHAGKLSLANGAHIVTNEFYNNFINLTGSGITIGLVIFTLYAARSAQMKSLGKIELVPALFNINEPFLFGLPLVMNPFLAIPFFLTPVIVALTTYLVIYFGIVPPLNGVAAPWTTPPIISGFLIGGWKMAIWQAIVLVMSTAIYFPFAKKYDNYLLAQEQAKVAKETK